MKKFILTFIFVCFILSPLFAFDENNTASNLSNLFAVGYVNKDMPSVTARYWIDDKLGVEGSIGFEMGKGPSVFLTGAKVLLLLQNYKTINTYGCANVAIGTLADDNGCKYTDFKVGGGFGVEWFVINRLSLSAEVGVELDGGNNNTKFGTYAGWFPEIGIRFYF